jgi:hypothetical protein
MGEQHTRRRWLAGAAVAVVVVAAAAMLLRGPADVDDAEPVPEPPVAPGQWSHPQWDLILGGDAGASEQMWVRLDAFSDIADPGLEAAASQAVVARLTSPVPDDVDPSDPDLPLYGTCTEVVPVATSAAALPAADVVADASWAKVLVAWRGTCNGAGAPGDGVHLSSAYARSEAGGPWVVVDERQVPGSGYRWLAVESNVTLVDLGCGGPGRLAAEVAAAWDAMCRDAEADGVELRAADTFRDPAEQRALWDTAVDEVGADPARRWVVRPGPDGACRSRHCDGAAVDVAESGGVLAWLTAPGRCQSGDTFSDPVDGSCAGSTPVPRHLLYGFLAPYPHIPNHLEWGQATVDSNQVGCGPSSGDVGSRIAAVWRCRLALAGIPAVEIVDSAAGAVAAARCASGWNAAAVASNGAYATTPDPRTGKVDTRAGLFMFDDATSSRWVQGDPADLDATVAGAADLWMSQRDSAPWASFGCPDVAAAPPQWAYQH